MWEGMRVDMHKEKHQNWHFALFKHLRNGLTNQSTDRWKDMTSYSCARTHKKMGRYSAGFL